MSDLLQKLEADLATEEGRIKRAQAAATLLKVAIEAIKKQLQIDEGASQVVGKVRKPNKRGMLSTSVLESIRRGQSTVSSIKKDLERNGIMASQGSISNSIQRLQQKRLVYADVNAGTHWWRAKITAPPEDGEADNGSGAGRNP